MGTRSRIGIEYPDGTNKTVYCHSDGYLSWNGAKLNKFYNTKAKVEELLLYGDLSSLDNKIDMCRFYLRDIVPSSVTCQAVVRSSRDGPDWEEYGYLFVVKTKSWLVYHQSCWTDLTQALIKERLTS